MRTYRPTHAWDRSAERTGKWLAIAMFAAIPVFLFGGWINNSLVMTLGLAMLFGVPAFVISVEIIDGARNVTRALARWIVERGTPPPR